MSDMQLTAKQLAARWHLSPRTIYVRHSRRRWLLPATTEDCSGARRLLFSLDDVEAFERRARKEARDEH